MTSFVRASREPRRTVFSMPWGARGTVVPWAVGGPTRRLPVLPRPAPPRPAAPPCAAPPRPPVVCLRFELDKSTTLRTQMRIQQSLQPKRIEVLGLDIIAAAKTYCIPGHALHEKDLQRRIGTGTLVSSQERRTATFLRINRL